MYTRDCTCAGTAPGFPQHEPFCGEPEDDGLDDPCEAPDWYDDRPIGDLWWAGIDWDEADRAYEVNR
jgi:hypothetical protein